jgi:thiosulfate/3-mercaptopyruvate sulfurtransferase
VSGYPRAGLLATTEWLAERLDDPSIRIVDCDEFAAYQRLHIPGAVHLEWLELNTAGEAPELLPADETRRRLEAVGITPKKEVLAQ